MVQPVVELVNLKVCFKMIECRLSKIKHHSTCFSIVVSDQEQLTQSEPQVTLLLTPKTFLSLPWEAMRQVQALLMLCCSGCLVLPKLTKPWHNTIRGMVELRSLPLVIATPPPFGIQNEENELERLLMKWPCLGLLGETENEDLDTLLEKVFTFSWFYVDNF